MKRYRLVQISMLLKKKKLTLLKLIYFHLETQTKKLLVFFRIRPGKA